ncbi:hypothetical protein Tco_1157152 [Tanacetum coccineum]
MASRDARLSKFESEFKQQQSEMTNKINTVLKAITDQIASTLPSDTVKNPKLGTHPISSACSYPTKDPQSSTHIHSLINAIKIHPKQPDESQVNEPGVGSLGNISSNPHPQPDRLASIAIEQVRKLNSMLKSLGLVPQSSNTRFVCTKEEDGEVMFIEIIRDNDEPQNESPNEGEGTTTEGLAEEYFDTFPPRDELTYHKNEEDKRRGVDYVMSKILGFYKKCLEFGPEYVTGLDDEGEVTYGSSMRKSLSLILDLSCFLYLDAYNMDESVFVTSSNKGFAAALAVLVIRASQSRQHGKSESDSYYLSD